MRHRSSRSPAYYLAVTAAVCAVVGCVRAWVIPELVGDLAKPATFAGLPDRVLDAHRGGGGEDGVRENSISGAKRMLEAGMVDVLDVDTRPLADGTPVLMHDASLDRTTDHTGPVSSYTAATLSRVRLDTGAGIPEPVATLAEYLDELGGKSVITVEAKEASEVSTLASMIKSRGLLASVLVNTNDPQVARRIHDAGLITHLWRGAAQLADDDPREWSEYVDLLDVDYRATDAQIQAAVNSGIPRVWAHALETSAQRDRVLGLGVTGIITDYPLTLSQR